MCMLSVCIPVYNTPVGELAASLSAQAQALSSVVEILLLDDGSDPASVALNAPLGNLPGVRWLEQTNGGRSAARNRLAELARGEYLLFVDCDCKIPDGFLKHYLATCEAGAVVVGGLTYPPRPDNRRLLLRWKVGVFREMRSVTERQQQVYHHFLSSNFLIPRALFKRLGFNQNLVGYGHEDTLFGLALRRNKTDIRHIDNPVTHLGLDRAEAYMPKVEESVNNLLQIVQEGYSGEDFRLWRAYQKLQKAKLVRPMAWFFGWMRWPLRKALTGLFPSLFLLDLYKLGWLSRAALANAYEMPPV